MFFADTRPLGIMSTKQEREEAEQRGAASDALDRAIVRLAKAQERQDLLAGDSRADGLAVASACQDRDVFLADVVKLGAMHLRTMREIDPDSVTDFGDDD